MWKMLYVCDPPCLSMRNNAPVEHCVAEVFIPHLEIVRTMKASFTLPAYLTTVVASIAQGGIKILPAVSLKNYC